MVRTLAVVGLIVGSLAGVEPAIAQDKPPKGACAFGLDGTPVGDPAPGACKQHSVDDEDTPLVRIPPEYPRQALAEELEGRCTLTFDIQADGAVDAASIVADCSSPLFVEEATRAVGRWRYRPVLVDGQPVARQGIETTLDWRFAD